MRNNNIPDQKDLWNSKKVTQSYASMESLLRPELTILNEFKERLPEMRMLDLGIGGGRTTMYFEPLVREYTGSDYAEKMVEASRERFSQAKPNTRFEVIDATSMAGIPDQHYDLVLFSFNGIDCIAEEDRHKVFREVLRVSRAGGYFVFSTHNIQYLSRMYQFRMRKNLKEFLYQFYRYVMMVRLNGLPSRYAGLDHAVICNGVEKFQLNLYYVEPASQVKQLQAYGFKNVRVYSNNNGKELSLDRLNNLPDEAWLYYVCEI